MDSILDGAALAFGADFFEVLTDVFEVVVGEMFDLNHFVARVFQGVNDFVELEVNGTSVAILGVLNQEDDEESDDGGGGVYDELPGIREMKVRAAQPPEKNNKDGGGERPFRADDDRGASCKGVKAAVVALRAVVRRCHVKRSSISDSRISQIPKGLTTAGTKKLALRTARRRSGRLPKRIECRDV